MSTTPDPNSLDKLQKDLVDAAVKAGVKGLDQVLTSGPGSRDWRGRPIQQTRPKS